MQITYNALDTQPGPADWFTGQVFIDQITSPTPSSRVGAASVHCTPGSRTAWHTYPLGQTIYVTEGIGRCHREGGPLVVIKPGDRVHFEPGEVHWHGAAAWPVRDAYRHSGSRRSDSPVTLDPHTSCKVQARHSAIQ